MIFTENDSPAVRLRTIRAYYGLTQVEAAELIGTDQTQVARWETGKTHPTRLYREAIARAYDVPIDLLFPRGGEKE